MPAPARDRKGGPGIMRSDLLVINKIDLPPHVGADLTVMDRDARRMRGERPFVDATIYVIDVAEGEKIPRRGHGRRDQ